MKQLGLLFGNTAYAAAATFTAFFLGLAVGGWLWGRRATRMDNPLCGYAVLEAGIALTALLYFVVLPAYGWIYPLIFQPGGGSPASVATKFGLALLLVFPPALFMGGTVPLMGQTLIRDGRQFGRDASLLYGVNTLGAALGAYLAGFHLPLWLGYRGAYGVALGITLSVAVVAWMLSRVAAPSSKADALIQESAEAEPVALSRRAVTWLSFMSGFGVLGFEVLWTRMFAQVLQNSVYTYAAVLVTILLCLAVGAGLANGLARFAWRPSRVLCGLLVAAGLSAGMTPFVFMALTDNMRMVGGSPEWTGYVFEVFKTTILVLGIPGCLLGTVFPYLLKTCESRLMSAGKTLGDCLGINTVGAILGSLCAGFVLLDWIGLWPGVLAFSLFYLVLAATFPAPLTHLGVAWRAVAALGILLNVFWLNPSSLPRVLINENGDGETLVEVFDGSSGTVAVTRTFGHLGIKLNNHYGIGSTGSFISQQAQADIPLTIRPQTHSVFFLGMGTGITPGAALAPEYAVQRVVTCELVPEVAAAARKYFAPYVNGLFSDPRSCVVIDDGRHYLQGTREQFDLIDADLFVPCRSGAGSLYSVEHFRAVLRRLKPGGWFVQWLPLYQVSREEFGIIVRTMLEVFPQVTLWRNNYCPGFDVVGLAGHREAVPLPAVTPRVSNSRVTAVTGKSDEDLETLELPFNPQTALMFYCGNLTAAHQQFAEYPMNSDDHPWIEYLAPRSQQMELSRPASRFVASELLAFLVALQQACQAESDPMLANRSLADRRLPSAGLNLYKAYLADSRGNRDMRKQAWDGFVSDWLAGATQK